jgi:2-haloacid dehalogenase
MQRDTLLFDINETVLDLSSLKHKFESAFGDDAYMATWFSMLLHTSTVCILTDVKTNFGALAGVMLEAIAGRLEMTLTDQMRDDILGGFANLAPHSDIKPALTRLRSAGYRIVAFSNSSRSLISTQIGNSGLNEYFNETISVEDIGSFKPDSKAYEFVANHLNQPVQALRLVATHDWDTHGALSAGMKAAYIDRSGAPYHPLYRKPDISAKNMEELVTKIIATDA